MNYNTPYFKKLKNPLLNFPVETSTDMVLDEIKRFLSPLKSNLAVDKNVLNNFKYFENKPNFFLSLTSSFL